MVQVKFGGYLASDRKYDDEDRKDLHFLHNWQINEQFSTNLEYNYASDKDYLTDLSNNPNTKTDLNLRRAWELNYKNGIPGLKAQLKIEDFQTLDETTPYVDRPYARLPQFLLNYKAGNALGLEYEFNNDTAYFKRTLGLSTEIPTIALNQAAPVSTMTFLYATTTVHRGLSPFLKYLFAM